MESTQITRKPSLSLFHRKSIRNFARPGNSMERRHSRKWSLSSSSSSSSLSIGKHHYNPLSLHPPLCLNTSPHLVGSHPEHGGHEHEMQRYREDEEREMRFFHQTQHAEDHIQDLAEYSPIKGKNCYFDGSSARPCRDDDEEQWPLKDWQPIPGMTDTDSSSDSSSSLSSSSSSSSSSSPTIPQRRTMADDDYIGVFKRGSWKRRGVVFHLDQKDRELEEQHFELPVM